MVEFIEVVKTFGKKRVLDGINFRVPANTINQIVGDQSTGKSTILKMIYGAVKPDSGYIRVFDSNVSDLSYSGVVLLRRYLGIIFEDIRLINDLTIKENISVVTMMTKRNLYISENVFDMLAIGYLLDKYPYELSLSEQSLVNIARGIVFNFPLVLADEPLRYLAASYKKKVLDVFKFLNKEKGITFLITSQSVLDSEFNIINVSLYEKK